jgi:hypothetical protein
MSLTKEVKDLYNENCKMFLKEVKGDIVDGNTFHVHGSEVLILLRRAYYLS